MLRRILLLLAFAGLTVSKTAATTVILISANAEWKVVRSAFPSCSVYATPYGEYFDTILDDDVNEYPVTFFHQGWGKVAAAGATQYAIDRWHPDFMINLGTCGGFQGKINRYDVVLANQTIIYDIREAMGDSREAIRDYSVTLDLSWLPATPVPVVRTALVSADRDLVPAEVASLQSQYQAVAGDWESGAIAWVANRNHVPLLILRGVTDLVSARKGEAYGNMELFQQGTRIVMNRLMADLPRWLAVLPKP